jgi:hypothetical protein
MKTGASRSISSNITGRERKELGFRGHFGQASGSLSESGRGTGAWVKHRVNKGQEFVIGGYVPANPLDSIVVGYYDDGKLIYVAKVRNGSVPHTRREMWAKLKGLESMTVCLKICWRRTENRIL